MQQDKPDTVGSKPFPLLRYYAWISLAGIVVAGVVFGMLFHSQAIDNLVHVGENRNLMVGKLVANDVRHTYANYITESARHDKQGILQHPQYNLLHADIKRLITATPILKVKIYTPDGKVLFSTEPKQIGQVDTDHPLIDQAMTGKVNTQLSFRDVFYKHEEMLSQRNVLSTYMPIQETASDRQGKTNIGVIEIYSDVTDIYNRIANMRVYLSLGVIGILLALYALLFVFVRRADGVIARQFTEKQIDEERIRHVAFHDRLTGLPNREMYHFKLRSALAQAKRNDTLLAILFMDLDRFKQINDKLGHHVGDALLKEVAERLVNCVRGGDTVARQGGDEFTLLLEQVKHIEEVEQICSRIIEEISRPYEIGGHSLVTSISIGVTIYPFDDSNIEFLLKDADAAMYAAKEDGRNNYKFYASAMKKIDQERAELEMQLRRALKEDEYLLHYQPIVDLRTGNMVGVEALLRWENNEIGLVQPGRFIPILEESGLMSVVGEWVLETACHKLKVWIDEGYAPFTIAVNISMVQFRQSNFVETVKNALDKSGLPAEYLKIEITESMLMDNSDISVQKLNQVRDLGVVIEADDFGTGYSSLSYLKKLPINILKIDRSFVTDVHTSSDSAGIVTAIMALAHSLKLDVIAEGVEQVEELKYLAALNCNMIQGFLFSKPLPEAELLKVMQNPGYFIDRLAEARAAESA